MISFVVVSEKLFYSSHMNNNYTNYCYFTFSPGSVLVLPPLKNKQRLYFLSQETYTVML